MRGGALCRASNRAMLKNMRSIKSFCLAHRPEALGTTSVPTNQSASTIRTLLTIMSISSWETQRTGHCREGLRLFCCLRGRDRQMNRGISNTRHQSTLLPPAFTLGATKTTICPLADTSLFATVSFGTSLRFAPIVQYGLGRAAGGA